MAQIPRADEGLICPLHKQDMSEVCHKCPWWMQLRMIDANTGKEIDEWRCAVGWLPHLLIEGAQQSRQAGASVDKMCNEVVKRMDLAGPPLQVLKVLSP